MRQHPIPQNVTAYEFHLIGNMTLKQFLEVGAGVGGALLFYSLPLPTYIQWPLIIISLIIGAALAFLPFDGRPLDRMIIVFFKAVYAPTQYIWRKDAQVPAFFNYTRKPDQKTDPKELERQKMRKNLGEYLKTLPGSGPTSDLDQSESQFIDNITHMFDTVAPSVDVSPGAEISFPGHTKVSTHKMKQVDELKNFNPDRVSNLLRSVSVQAPDNTPVAFSPQPVTDGQASDSLTTPTPQNDLSVMAQPSHELHRQDGPISTTAAKTSTNLPFPKPPEQPNTLVGMVVDNQGKIVENAVIEVRDQHNTPVRALKTNSLGQFFSASPLSNGKYQLEVEKPGYNFDILSIELTGKKVSPLEITAK